MFCLSLKEAKLDIKVLASKIKTSYFKEFSPNARIMPEYPGYIRRILIRKSYIVSVEFELYNMDEGGAYFNADFNKLQEAVSCIEDYIDVPLEDWRDASTKDFESEIPDNTDISIGHEQLKKAIKNKEIILPSKGRFELVTPYWKQFE